jgi:group I intron endonuclease
MGCIYKIECTVNKKIYIGQTKCNTPAKRFKQHIDTSKKMQGYALHNAIRTHGEENFTIEMLYQSDNQDELNEKEKYYIEFYKSKTTENGYNITGGGKGVIYKRVDKENYSLEKRMRGLKEYYKNVDKKILAERCRNQFKGKKLSPEHIEKIRKYKRDKKKSKEHIEKIRNAIIEKYKNGTMNNNLCIQKMKEKQIEFYKSKCKFTEEDIKNIRKLYEIDGKTQIEIAQIYNVSNHTISKIITNKIYKYLHNENSERNVKKRKKLTDDEIRFIRKNKDAVKHRDLAKQFNVSEKVIYGITKGKTYINLTD